MRLIIEENDAKAGLWTARYIVARIKEKAARTDRPFVLGLPTGSTPVETYKELVSIYESGEVSFRKVVTFNMEEFVGITEDHPDYEAVKNMFGKKRREIEAKAEAEAGTPPEFVPLDAVIAAFEAAESVTALKEAATRLGIPENHPDSEAIYAAYRERQRKIEAQDKERAA